MVLGNSEIRDIDTRIQDSLIGSHVEISRSPIKPKALKLALADYSQVGIL
jgi:glucose-1-phosphate thymidylyltransferase